LPRRLLPAALAAAALCSTWTANAFAFTKTDGTLEMRDGVSIATTLYLPDGTPPPAGWPSILMLHGLGGSRQDTNALAEGFFVPQGYAVMTYDARGHGQSGGLVTVAGPAEIADEHAVFDALAARPDIDGHHIGGWGISYGGGELLRGLVEGIPYAAVETFETWTDLYGALFPQNLPKSGIVGGFLNEIPAAKLSPDYAFLRTDGIDGTNLPRLRQLSADRSTLSQLSGVKTPVFMLQGRRDFAFGIDQAVQAYTRLAGPKRLYIGDHGHAPSTFPAPDTTYAMTEGRQWFDRFLKGIPNGIDTRPPIEVAPNPWRGKAVSYPGLPPTRTLTFSTSGSRTIGPEGAVARVLATAKAPLEEFGSPTVTVRVAPKSWSRVVAVLTAAKGGSETVVSAGGVPVTRSGTVSIRMIDDATFIPAGSRLKLYVAGTTVNTPAGLLYLDLPTAAAARLTVAAETVKMPVLVKPISR
jgi:pimeloyl-ACP methyl ester carboxylesterase